MLNQSYFIGQASMIHSYIFLLFKGPNTYTFAPFGSHLKIETVGADHFLGWQQGWLLWEDATNFPRPDTVGFRQLNHGHITEHNWTHWVSWWTLREKKVFKKGLHYYMEGGGGKGVRWQWKQTEKFLPREDNFSALLSSWFKWS